MHTWKFSQKLLVMQCHNFLQAWTLSCQHCYPGQVFAQLENSQYFVWIVVSKTIIKRHIIWSVLLSVDNIAIQVKFFSTLKQSIFSSQYVKHAMWKMLFSSGLERWIVTIPSLYQWLATIENTRHQKCPSVDFSGKLLKMHCRINQCNITMTQK